MTLPDPLAAAGRHLAALVLIALAAPAVAPAETSHPGPPISIARAAGAISVDGDLSDAGWQGVAPVTTWFETRTTDNTEPTVRNLGYLAYDDRYLYAGFRFDDPDPKQIRAPIADRDQLSGATDYGGVIIDSNDDGKSAVMFLANANGLMYDAVTNDASGEDSSPDFYWESAGRITETGWTLEIRVPFSSLRYARTASPRWGVMLYRNYPRDRHYQFFTARFPRNANCLVCNASALSGLAGLPHGSNLVVAPHATAQRADAPAGGVAGAPLANGRLERQAGVDAKWSPLASVAVDATYHPDFSQVEADAGQITANERFALFYPEKRSFFLEGIDLFSTPLQAVYTRSINAPDYGGRVTGRAGSTSFTALGAHDRGGGLVILPGPLGSDYAPGDFASDVGVARLRHDLGLSSVGLLATARTAGAAHSAVFGPDLTWRPSPGESFGAQALWSDARTPKLPAFATEWDGRELRDRALLARWAHNSRTTDVFVQGQDIGADFRANEGFIPQVGYREVYFESGYTLRPKDAFLSRVRLFTIHWYDADEAGRVVSRRASVGAGMDGRWSSFLRVELNRDAIRTGSHLFTRFQPYVTVQASPGRLVNNLSIEARAGEEIDTDNERKGHGATLAGSVTLRPEDHLEVSARTSARWLNVNDAVLGSGRLFAAHLHRLRATWSFNSHAFVRGVAQYDRTERQLGLYRVPAPGRRTRIDLTGLLGYKLNWQTVLYLGYGDTQEFKSATGHVEHTGRQAFAKVSYAVQI